MSSLWLHFVFPLAMGVPLLIWLANLVWPTSIGKYESLLGYRGAFGAATLLLALYAVGLVSCTLIPAVLDHIEVSVGSLSYLGLHGSPVYTSVRDARRYSLLYGPMCYLPYEAALVVLGPFIQSLKAAVVVLNVILFAVLWAVFHRMCPRWNVLIPLGFIASGMALDARAPFLIRGDAGLALGVALSILALSRRRRGTTVALFALGGAYAMDVKITAVFYLVILLYLLARSLGVRLAFLSVVIAGALAIAPFALAQFSVRNYAGWLREAVYHPLDGNLFLMNVVIAAILLAPPTLVFLSMKMQNSAQAALLFRRNRCLLALLGFSLCGSIVTGSKLGAGPTHLNPWFIVSGYIATLLWRTFPAYMSNFLRRSLAICTLIMIIPAASEASELWSTARHDRGWAIQVNEDVTSILNSNSGKSIGMSYETPEKPEDVTNRLNSFGIRLVLAGNPLLVDEGALDDMGCPDCRSLTLLHDL